MSHDFEKDPFLIDQITLICDGCKGERVFELPARLASAAELIAWMQANATRCQCDAAETCAVKCRMKSVD